MPGDRVKTDRRDASKPARLLRSGELTPTWIPDEQHEALRDLVRAREDAIEDQLRSRNRLTKYLLRLGVKPPDGVKAWSAPYKKWLDALRWERPVQQVVFAEYRQSLEEIQQRVTRFEREIETLAQTTAHAPTIAALQAMRGVKLITAATIVSELGDISRFENPRQLMAYAGMVPSEHSSGGNVRRGSITKTVFNSAALAAPGRGLWSQTAVVKVTPPLPTKPLRGKAALVLPPSSSQHELNVFLAKA